MYFSHITKRCEQHIILQRDNTKSTLLSTPGPESVLCPGGGAATRPSQRYILFKCQRNCHPTSRRAEGSSARGADSVTPTKTLPFYDRRSPVLTPSALPIHV
ncbi:hypothetical protein EVAR_37870_1 [Eumeta japonica]|uniref:Uncharacterized protein n=1 Tax=Eumeta variegata TaxID=151549 RepID=A0A4C1X492_EUMVA|nr:hypothetical protein EVAR_37870_1 [Eumeta japonica]